MHLNSFHTSNCTTQLQNYTCGANDEHTTCANFHTHQTSTLNTHFHIVYALKQHRNRKAKCFSRLTIFTESWYNCADTLRSGFYSNLRARWRMFSSCSSNGNTFSTSLVTMRAWYLQTIGVEEKEKPSTREECFWHEVFNVLQANYYER